MKQLLDSKEKDNDNEPKRVVVDRKKAMQNALKALENPELLKEEIFENGTTIEKSLPNEIEHILSITDKNTREFYESIIKGDYDKIQQTPIKSDVNIKSVEEILNSVKNKTDIETAITKINNIITTIQSDTSVENANTVEYVAYLQNINEQLQSLNTSVNEKLLENNIISENSYADNKSINIQNVQEIIGSVKNETDVEKETILPNEPESAIERIDTIYHSDEENTYVDNESTNINIQNVEEIINPVKNEIDKILSNISNTSQVFYDGLISGNQLEEYFTISDKVYNIRDIVDRKSDIGIQNVYDEIESIKSESDIVHAISKVKSLISELKTVNTVNTQTEVAWSEKNVFENTERISESRQKIHSYVNFLESIVNELENTRIINQVITQNNEVVEKYINDEVERILMNTLEYDESFIQVENSKQTKELVERSGIEREVIDSSLEDIFNTEYAGYLDNVVNRMYTERDRSISLIHATREGIQEEVVNEITQTVKTDTVNRINQKEEVHEDQVTTRQLAEMKRELIRQSEESITRIVNQNIQTQVHAISDMVYLELEKRLKNEQRRRGY
jgi:hypothetical protein